jgi:polyphosphate kinase 2 (PPK2 family)
VSGKKRQVPKSVYEPELLRLQTELVKLQEWVRAEGARLVVVFEGRDAAGKGGTIKRVTSSGMWNSCRRQAKSYCSTEAGTTARA